mgnify:FL=1|tara:strand:- start:1430 stop:2014 length:585 start_codon:yes stop_codon:yes gene_type:complete
MNDINQPEYLDDSDPEKNYDYWRQDHGNTITNHNGVADKLLQNDKLFNSLKGDWKRSDFNKSGNMKVTTGREDGKFYIQREQMNVQVIIDGVKDYRIMAEKGVADPLGPYMPDGTIGWKWMDLPIAVSIKISDDYFGGMPWHAIKHDRTLKAQFYRVVETEYPQFVCYPGGKLPIPIAVPYPTKVGQQKFFKGH